MDANQKAVANIFVMLTVKWAIIYGVSRSIRKAIEKGQ